MTLSNVDSYMCLLLARAELQAELGERKLTDDAVAEIMRYAHDVREGIKTADLDAKRWMLESLGVKVTIKGRRYLIKCVLGEAEGEIRKVGGFAKRTIETCTLV